MTNASGGFTYTSEDLLATARTLRTGAQRYQTALRRLQSGLTHISPETVGDDELAQALSTFTDRGLRTTTGAGNRVEQLAESLTQAAHAMTTRDRDTAHDLTRHHPHDQASHRHHHTPRHHGGHDGGHDGGYTGRHPTQHSGDYTGGYTGRHPTQHSGDYTGDYTGGHSEGHRDDRGDGHSGEWGEDPPRRSDQQRGVSGGGVFSGGTYSGNGRDDRDERGAGSGVGRVGS